MSAGLRLMWKEYRVLRGFWLALAVFGLACGGLIFLFVDNPQDRLPGLLGLAGTLPICFALGAGATLFALEREESTRDLLRYLPLTSLRIFASKICVALSGTLLLTLVLLSVGLAAVWITYGESALAGETAPSSAIQFIAVYGLLMLQAMGWSIFFSLQSARPLLAAVLGAVSAVVCISLVHIVAQAGGWSSVQPSFVVVFAHVAATAALWLVDAWLGSIWLHGRRAALLPRPNVVTRPMPLRRLIWQEWRSSWRMLAVLFALGLTLPLLQWADPYSGGVGVIPATGLVLALLGSCTFLGDQERSQFRFFADRGVSGRSLWFSRQSFWGGSASVLTMMLLAMHLFVLPLPSIAAKSASWTRTQFVLSWFGFDISAAETLPHNWTIDWLTGISGYMLWLSLAFGAGQLCSMFFRSGLLAAVCGVILAGLLLAWAALMDALSIAWWWSVAPLAAALFAATWLRANGWVVERRRLFAWLPSLLALVVPTAAVLTAVPVYRVLEIPKIDLDSLRPRMPPPTSADVNEAVRHLVTMCQQLPPLSATSFQTLSADVSPEEEQWLRENQGAVDAVVEALLRMPTDATAEDSIWKVASTWAPIKMLIRYGQMAEHSGDLDLAWTRYRALLEFAGLARRRSAVLGEVSGDSIERAVAPQLIRWGAREGQTVERLRAAADALKQLDMHDGSVAEMAWREYEGNLAHLEAIELRLHRHEDINGDAGVYALCAKLAPWEFTRARRLLRYVTFLDLREATKADTSFVSGTPYATSNDYEHAKADLFSQTTLLQALNPIDGVVEARRLALCYRRATQLALAAEEWRLEHGELPEKLDEMEQYVGPTRLSPYSNQPFLWFPWGLRLAVRSNNLPNIPPHTPLLFSLIEPPPTSDSQKLDVLRRQSADDSTWKESAHPDNPGGMPALPAGGAAPGGAPSAMGAATGMTPGQSEAEATITLPWALLDSPLAHLNGLAFPIPIAEDESPGRQ